MPKEILNKKTTTLVASVEELLTSTNLPFMSSWQFSLPLSQH